MTVKARRPRGNCIPGLNPHWDPLQAFSSSTRRILRGRRGKEPLAATPEDERNLRQMYDALTAFGAPGFARGGATLASIAWSLRRKVRHPGTSGSWRKRMRRLALLGWAKEMRSGGLWTLTAAGTKEARS